MRHRRALRTIPAAAVALVVALAALVGPVPTAGASTALDGFHPANLVSDAVFYHAGAMGRADVAAFVAARGSGCVAAPDGTPCLKDYRVATPAVAATAYCAAVAPVSSNTAAGVVSDVAAACGINPQMLLVLIQRESGLLTRSGSALTRALYTQATGAGCPDYSACSSGWASFFAQVYGAAEQFRKYRAHPASYHHRAGLTSQVAYHREPTCGKASLTFANQATAGLYNYTPFATNRASLDAVLGTGDACSSYGQRNFYFILKSWFPGSTSGSTAPAVAPSPASTVTPALASVLGRAATLTTVRTGGELAPMSCSDGLCAKRYAKLSILWTSARGATLGYAAGTPTLLAPYRDVTPGTAFAAEIEWLTAIRVAQGWSDGTFRPVTPVARDAMAAFLYRAAGSPAFSPPTRPTFVDVPASNPFYRQIEWLASRGITRGWSDGTFRPLAPIQRDAVAAFLYRFRGSPAYTPPSRATFSDVPTWAAFAKEIEWLAARGVTTGYGDGTYRPRASVNRDATAAFLYRLAVV